MKALCKYIASFVKLFKMTFVFKLPQVEIYYFYEYIEYGSHFLSFLVLCWLIISCIIICARVFTEWFFTTNTYGYFI